MIKGGVLIIDYGSQYNQLIARRVRENKVYCQILPPNVSLKEMTALDPKGIILSGGPSSVYLKKSPSLDRKLLNSGIPIFGICYGMQLIAQSSGGVVKKTRKREYGKTTLHISDKKDLFSGLPKKIISWMSHGDYVSRIPKGFRAIAHTPNTRYAAIAERGRKLYGVQFHPEVAHTEHGNEIISNFLFKICKCEKNWTMKSFIKNSISDIKKRAGKEKVMLALSGGVDSSVSAVLINKSIGKNLHCIFVDNGVMRKGEKKRVNELFKKHFKMNLITVDAQKKFLRALKGITDPEKKRKIIGKLFIRVFEEEAKKIGKVKFLAQGTLYPDLIESRSVFGGPSAVIKSHHNVGGLPKKMGLKIIEPLRELFKDEVRMLGKELGMPDEIVWRQPFPGPGLAVRIIGEVTEKRLNILKEVDAIIIEEAKKAGIYYKIWQSFAVLLPVKSVGVMGDERTYENVVAVRAVTSNDGMTADWAKLPYGFLEKISNRIINEVKGVNRVVYDISSKPPSTIEWE